MSPPRSWWDPMSYTHTSKTTPQDVCWHRPPLSLEQWGKIIFERTRWTTWCIAQITGQLLQWADSAWHSAHPSVTHLVWQLTDCRHNILDTSRRDMVRETFIHNCRWKAAAIIQKEKLYAEHSSEYLVPRLVTFPPSPQWNGAQHPQSVGQALSRTFLLLSGVRYSTPVPCTILLWPQTLHGGNCWSHVALHLPLYPPGLGSGLLAGVLCICCLTWLFFE